MIQHLVLCIMVRKRQKDFYQFFIQMTKPVSLLAKTNTNLSLKVEVHKQQQVQDPPELRQTLNNTER